MKRKRMALFIGICLLCTACQGAEEQKISQKQKKQQEAELSQKTEFSLSYTDYSQELAEEESGTVLLEVHENCPVVDIKGNDETESRINRVFEQQHTRNGIKIDNKLSKAESDFFSLEETEQWKPYKYTYTYKDTYISSDILSMKALQSEEAGDGQSVPDVVAYTFYVPEGKLLTLSDVFTEERAVQEIVEPYIQKTVTGEDYRKYLLEDYESYISDILAEDVFYLDDKGMVIICNAGLLTEEEAGAIEIHVPYKALKDVMNEQYMPKDR